MDLEAVMRAVADVTAVLAQGQVIDSPAEETLRINIVLGTALTTPPLTEFLIHIFPFWATHLGAPVKPILLFWTCFTKIDCRFTFLELATF